jgi:hypothetical protein
MAQYGSIGTTLQDANLRDIELGPEQTTQQQLDVLWNLLEDIEERVRRLETTMIEHRGDQILEIEHAEEATTLLPKASRFEDQRQKWLLIIGFFLLLLLVYFLLAM